MHAASSDFALWRAHGEVAVSPHCRKLIRGLHLVQETAAEFLHSGEAGSLPPPWKHAEDWLAATRALLQWDSDNRRQFAPIERGSLNDFSNLSGGAITRYSALVHDARRNPGSMPDHRSLRDFMDWMEHVQNLCRRLNGLLLEAMLHHGALTHAPRMTNPPSAA